MQERNLEVGQLTGVVGVPLVPGIKGHLGAYHVPVEAGLENGGLASVTVDTDPLFYFAELAMALDVFVDEKTYSTTRLFGLAGAPRDRGHNNSASDLGEAGAAEDSTGPVGAVLDIGLVRCNTLQRGLDHGQGFASSAAAALGQLTSSTGFTTLLSEPGAESDLRTDQSTCDGRELHDE